MKNWSGKNLCFECAGKLGANINIGRKLKGRCHRCHSEQTLFKVLEVPNTPITGEDVCPECAHPVGTHEATCRRSELELLRTELQEIVKVLEEFAPYNKDQPIAEQFRQLLRRAGDSRGE